MRKRINLNKGDRIYYIFCYTLVVVLALIVLYPIVYILSASFSNSNAVVQGKVVFFPVEPSLVAYKLILRQKNVWIGYLNTIIYTVVGTVFNVAITLICAYPMARKNLRGRGIIMFFFSFTMMFSGGMVPGYILVKNLHLMNTRAAMIIPGAMSVYNMIVCRTFIQSSIPDEMLDAAQIDGCNDFQFFGRFVVPLSKAVIAVLSLWYGIGHWNAYMGAFLYLKDRDKYPLQIFLRELLIESAKVADTDIMQEFTEMSTIYVTMKYALIVVSSAPLLCVYPFIQKYFQKGVMVGSVKG